MHLNRAKSSSRTTFLLGLVAAVLVIIIIVFPEHAFESSLGGLTLWWKYVFPALLPFLIITEIIAGIGILHALGTLLQPFMRLFFGIPGIGGWALAVGLFAGYPAGADVTARLRKQNLISRGEAESMLAITHLCNPLIMITLIGIGFLQDPRLGLFIAVIHYAAAFAAGWATYVFRPLSKTKPELEKRTLKPLEQQAALHKKQLGIVSRAISNMQQAYLEDGRTLGKLLGDAVSTSIQKLMILGGFIMIFSVINQVITLLTPTLLANELVLALIPGILEPHLGSYAINQWDDVPSILWKTAWIGAVLAWSGLSVHAQVRSFVHSTDIRYAPFFIFRCVHAGFAFLFSFLLWRPFHPLFLKIQPSFGFFTVNRAGKMDTLQMSNASPWTLSLWLVLMFMLLLLVMISISLIIERMNRSFRKREHY